MVTLKSSIKKIVSLLLMLTMVLTVVPCVASATTGSPVINTTKKGSITVTKYASADTSATKGKATGTNSDTVDTNYYTPLNGATFKLFKIADADAVMAYYNGTSTTTYSLEQFDYQDDGTAKYNNVSIDQACTWEGITSGTGENAGKYTFSNLPIGIYVLKEVTAPNQIAAPLAEDSLISIPMVNTASSSNNGNAEWMYDVSVYPKNHASTGTVELTKVDQNNVPLENVVFELYKKEFLKNGQFATDDWTQVTDTTDNAGTSTQLTLKTDSNGKLTVANLPSGLYGTQYKLVEVSAPNGYIVNQTPLYFKVNNDNTITWNATSGDTNGCNNTNTGVTATTITTDPKLSITLRNELPSLIKEVKQNGGDTWKTDEQYRLDDEITYRLTVYVPKNVAELGTFEIKDVPQVGITDSESSSDYTVNYGDAANACNASLRADNYMLTKLEASGNNGQGFKLELNSTGKGLVAGKFIQIVYKAHMNANAVIAEIGNGNTATLTYSKSISGGNENYTITDEARVYTYQFQITKYKDSVAEANKLKDGEWVEFQLLDTDKNPMKVVKLAEGEYRLAIDTDSDTVKLDKMVTNTNSTILIRGLENGTYYLKETKTIANYNLLSKPFEFKVEVTETTTWTEDGSFTPDGSIVKTYQSTTYTPTDPTGIATIINKKGFVLPQTGGMGYLLFCTVGIVLIAGGAMLIFGGRKKKIR